MIFTLINSVNKACRGRIYTHDYIGLIKKKRERERKKRQVRRGDNKGGGGEAGGDAGREQADWWRHT